MIEILEPGLQATVQDYAGRPGMLRQGFFPPGRWIP
jgi:allophanate hydrolase subunit 2